VIRRRLGEFARRHPVWFGIAATLVWCCLILVATLLPPHPLYGPMYVNAIGLAAGLGVVAVLGWGREVGLRPVWSGRRMLLLLPLVVLVATYALPGVTATAYLTEGIGPGEEAYVLACIAIWCLLIGLNEELWSRGIVLHPLRRLGPFRSALIVAAIFSAQHLLNLFAFGAGLDDTIAQLVSTFAFGVVLVALRWHGITILPLAVLHGLGDFLQLASPGAAPLWWQAAIAAFELGYGVWLLRTVPAAQPA